MRRVQSVIVVVSLAIGMVVAKSANAATVTAKFTGAGPSSIVRIYADSNGVPGYELNQQVHAGVYSFEVISSTYAPFEAGDTLKTFCIDLAEHISNDGVYTWDVLDVTQAPVPTTYAGSLIDAGQKLDLQKLYDQYYATALGGTSTEAAAFQVGVWEIVNEHFTPVTYDALNGSFAVESGGVASQADAWLDSLATYTFPSSDRPLLKALVSEGVQDQIVLIPGGSGPRIPEPLTVLGLFMGLGGIGAYIRKRRLAA